MTDQIEKYFFILPLLLGSLVIALATLLISVPLGLITAIYISDYAAFFLARDLVEYEKGVDIFMHLKDKRTEDCIMGRFV